VTLWRISGHRRLDGGGGLLAPTYCARLAGAEIVGDPVYLEKERLARMFPFAH
jgi:hypothetical protein